MNEDYNKCFYDAAILWANNPARYKDGRGALVGHVIKENWMPAVGERFKFANHSDIYMRLPGVPGDYSPLGVMRGARIAGGTFPAVQLTGIAAGRLVWCASGWRFFQHEGTVDVDDEQFLTINTCECGKREMP